MNIFPENVEGLRVYLIGIKGTGMAAMAELLQYHGAKVSGSDGDQKFYTDELLESCGIPFFEGFDSEHITGDIDLVIYSSAYNQSNPEIAQAVELGLSLFTYPEALGAFSSHCYSVGIAGVHGKTTTTAIAGTLAKAAGLSFSMLVGSTVPALGGRAAFCQGRDYFIAETCEYRRNFMSFRPSVIVLTSVEPDHLDYFKDYADIKSAFVEYIRSLPPSGILIVCADDPGAVETAAEALEKRPDIRMIPYGFKADGRFRILSSEIKDGRNLFSLEGFSLPLALKVPGIHSVVDAAAAAAVVTVLKEKDGQLLEGPVLAEGLLGFTGTRRRTEIVGERDGILFIDDYGHHPTAIKTTLQGLRDFYGGRRLVVDFMSHTYSRTAALLKEFSESFSAADMVILHKIYASAREAYQGTVSGRDLYAMVKERQPEVYYYHELKDAVDPLREILQSGDVFVTMGAGDNWQVGKALLGKDKEGLKND